MVSMFYKRYLTDNEMKSLLVGDSGKTVELFRQNIIFGYP